VNQTSELGQTLTISTNGKDISDWKQLDGSLELTTKAMPMTTDIKVKIKYL